MIKLSEISTNPPDSLDKEKTKEETILLISRFSELQNVLYAEHKHSLLIVLQGMDASGKDGAIKKVFTGVNPMGCNVTPFKKPTEEQADHDFLWRIHRHAPAKGMIQIFNRSHYEEVLIQRVGHWVDEDCIKRRFHHINHFEKLLQENGTQILKFYLHISKKEQEERLEERLIDLKKKWKYNVADVKERGYWDDYMKAYEDVFHHCSPEIPWTIIPSDKNWYKEYLIAKKIVEVMEGLGMKYPEK